MADGFAGLLSSCLFSWDLVWLGVSTGLDGCQLAGVVVFLVGAGAARDCCRIWVMLSIWMCSFVLLLVFLAMMVLVSMTM